MTSPTYRFPKTARLLKAAQFQGVVRARRRFVGAEVLVDWRMSQGLCARLGITVPKRLGKAHDRNRFKRLTREVFRQWLPSLPSGLEINVLPRRLTPHLKKGEIEEDLKKFFDRFHEQRVRREPSPQ